MIGISFTGIGKSCIGSTPGMSVILLAGTFAVRSAAIPPRLHARAAFGLLDVAGADLHGAVLVEGAPVVALAVSRELREVVLLDLRDNVLAHSAHLRVLVLVIVARRIGVRVVTFARALGFLV